MYLRDLTDVHVFSIWTIKLYFGYFWHNLSEAFQILDESINGVFLLIFCVYGSVYVHVHVYI